MAAKELTPGQRRFSPASVGADVVLLGWFVFSLFPLVWMVLLALKTNADQITTYFAFTPTLDNFTTVLSDEGTQLTSVDFTDAIVTSVVNCVGAVLVSLVIGIPAAYAAGRWRYRGSNDVMFTILSFRFAPELMVIVPLFVIYNQLGLFDTNVGHGVGAAAGDDATDRLDPALLLPGPARRVGAGRAARRLHPLARVRAWWRCRWSGRGSQPRRCSRSSSPGTTTCSR